MRTGMQIRERRDEVVKLKSAHQSRVALLPLVSNCAFHSSYSTRKVL